MLLCFSPFLHGHRCQGFAYSISFHRTTSVFPCQFYCPFLSFFLSFFNLIGEVLQGISGAEIWVNHTPFYMTHFYNCSVLDSLFQFFYFAHLISQFLKRIYFLAFDSNRFSFYSGYPFYAYVYISKDHQASWRYLTTSIIHQCLINVRNSNNIS